jgi:hypothetical protein
MVCRFLMNDVVEGGAVDAFGVLNEVLGDYRSFVTGFLNIQDDRVCAKVDTEIESGLLWPEPWLALNPAFEPGGTVADLVNRGVLSAPECPLALPELAKRRAAYPRRGPTVRRRPSYRSA